MDVQSSKTHDSDNGKLVLHLVGPRARVFRGPIEARFSGVIVAVNEQVTTVALRPGPHTVEIRRGRWVTAGYADYGINLGPGDTVHLSYNCRPSVWMRHHIERVH